MDEYNNELLEILQSPPSPEEILEMKYDQVTLRALLDMDKLNDPNVNEER